MNLKVDDSVVIISGGERQDCVIEELEMNLGQLWLRIRPKAGKFTSVPLRGVTHHSVPATRIVEHHPALIIEPTIRIRKRVSHDVSGQPGAAEATA